MRVHQTHTVNPRKNLVFSSNQSLTIQSTFRPILRHFPMASNSKTIGAKTPSREKTTRSNSGDTLRYSENVNPNVSSPGLKFSTSPSSIKPEKSAKKSASKNPKPNHVALASPSPKKKKIRERKFVIAKKKLRNEESSSSAAAVVVACEKCKTGIGKSKCLCVAYESLRASQEEFFKNRGEIEDDVFDKVEELGVVAEKAVVKPEINKASLRNGGNAVLSEINLENQGDRAEVGANKDVVLKRSRDKLLEEARQSVSILGSGRVLNLVKEFEKLSMLKSGVSEDKEVEGVEDANDKSKKWEFPEMQQPRKASDSHDFSSLFCPSDFFLTSESLGLDPRRSHSLDSSQGSISSITSASGRRLRRSSTESSGNRTRRHWKKKQLNATSQRPFMLKTEERGRFKEKEFMKKLQKMIEEEEKMRIPIAQGLPWTTDEPECLAKPPVKESTKPIDLVLHSNVRALERSEFDHQVAMKLNLIQHYRMERERQQKLEEEEIIRRLRKELIPKAQPMPYFDRPFIPQRSVKHPTIPKEPKFHMPQLKKIKCHFSLDDLCTLQH